SYGWSGQSVGIIENALSEIGFEIIAPSARHQFAPGAEVLEKYAAEVAAALPECEAESGKAAANAAGCIGYGLYILSANENGKDFACVTNTLLQVTSSEPLKFVATVSKRNHTHGIIERTGKFNISTLTEDVPFELIKRFGFQSGRDADKFDGFDDFKRSRNGLAYVAGNANAYMSFEVADSADFGTHTLFTATLTESAVLNDRESVTYAYYQKNIKPKPILGQNKKVGFRCGVCGYEYEGETLPEDFICPLCKHGAGDFVKI
ncbi:MAG: flavin reductase, partial [Defluviitaleaceae bacterium]|nr:flavin reductase [Defluviitaleaceae bacterium]